MSKRSAPIRTASPVLRELFEIADRDGVMLITIADRANTHPVRVSGYRRGKNQPGVMVVEEMAHALGYRLCLVPLDDSDTKL